MHCSVDQLLLHGCFDDLSSPSLPCFSSLHDSVCCVLLCFCIDVTFAVSFKLFEVDFLLACCEPSDNTYADLILDHKRVSLKSGVNFVK